MNENYKWWMHQAGFTLPFGWVDTRALNIALQIYMQEMLDN